MSDIDVFIVAGQSNAGPTGGDSSLTPMVPIGHGYDAAATVTDVLPNLDKTPWPAFINAYYKRSSVPVAIVRTSAAATSLLADHDDGYGNWSPSGTLRGTAVTTTTTALAALVTAGFTPTLRGVLWSQGESDTDIPDETRVNYSTELSALLDYFQSALSGPSLKLYIIRTGLNAWLGDTPGFQEIRREQDSVANTDPDILMVYTNTFLFSARGWLDDAVHYNQYGKNDIGTRVGAYIAEYLYRTHTYPYNNVSVHPGIARQGLRDISELDNRQWRGSQWIAADHSAMGIRPDGMVIVGCGDTFMNGTINPDGSFDSGFIAGNCLLLWKDGAFGVETSKTNLNISIFNAPFPYFPGIFTPSGFRWPRSFWYEPRDGLMHAFTQDFAGNIFTSYTSVNVTEFTIRDDWTFVSSSRVPGLAPQDVPVPEDSGIPRQVTWGQANIIDQRNRYSYIFGGWRRWVGYRPVLCRRHQAYGSLPNNLPEFWTGSGWSDNMQDVAVISDDDELSAFGSSYGVIEHPGGGWLITSCSLFSPEVGAWHSYSLTGPYTYLGSIFTVVSELPGQWQYGGHSYIASNGKLRICYSTFPNSSIATKADYTAYGVRWAEVDVPGRP